MFTGELQLAWEIFSFLLWEVSVAHVKFFTCGRVLNLSCNARDVQGYGKCFLSLRVCVQDVITLAQTPLVDLMRQTIEQEVEDEILNLQAQLQSSTITQTDHDVAKAQLELYETDMLTNIDRRGQCPDLAVYNYGGYPSSGPIGSIIPTDNVYAVSIGGGAALIDVTLDPPGGTTLTYNSMLPSGGTTCNSACVCTKMADAAGAARDARFESMQNSLVSRLDRNSGRIGDAESSKAGAHQGHRRE